MVSNSNLTDEVISNAIDFLESAFDEFNKRPKYSVVNFCTAIELILKARLMHEHWSLVVDGKPNASNFKAGNFKSINFKELVPRIEGVLNESISPDAKRCFEAIANHRNKMVHFFHEADSSQQQEILQQIAIEQSTGWFFLRRLIEKWSEVFEGYNEKISSLNYRMKRHKVYLDTVFQNIKPEIDVDCAKGEIYRKCSSCDCEASKEIPLTDCLIETKCRVCLVQDFVMKIECPECDQELELAQHDDGCAECSNGHVVDGKEAREQLETDGLYPDDYINRTPVNCAFCMGMDTVFQHDEYWICDECIYVDSEMAVCGWCDEGQIGGGDIEFSFVSGCEFCDGRAGWD